MLEIRKATNTDWEALWSIIKEVFLAGNTYPHAPETTKEEAYKAWMLLPTVTYLAMNNNEVAGTYYIKPNQPGLGSHVCNAGYIVDGKARGKGIGHAMCTHSLKEAIKLGFKAMQFNLVVSTNVKAFKLWKDMGFDVIGTLPKAFNHKEEGLVDAYIMYKWLNKDA